MNVENFDDPYRLLIVTPIPVQRDDKGYSTLDLWVRDLEAQRQIVASLCVVAPLGVAEGSLRKIPDGITIVPADSVVSPAQIGELVSQYDVIQVFARSRRQSSTSLSFARAARDEGRCLIMGISSNRVQTTILNARGKSWPRRLKANVVARSICSTQKRVARMADGVFLCGHGLVDMVDTDGLNVHVDVASWIREHEVIDDESYEIKMRRASEAPTLSACVATRLEPMKGVQLAIEALRTLREHLGTRAPSLVILGSGPEQRALEELVEKHGLGEGVQFRGTFAYPDPFFAEIRRYDVMLLTNLNVEQPRIIFDALSQGLLPVCPDSTPYQALKLDKRIMYRRGDALALAEVIANLDRRELLTELMSQMRQLVRRFTVDSMHLRRAAWVAGTLRQIAGPSEAETSRRDY